MKPTTTPVFVSPVRPQICQSRLIHGSTGRAAGAQWPRLPTAQDGQSKSLPGSRGGSPEIIRGYRLFFILLLGWLTGSLAYAEVAPTKSAPAGKAVIQPKLPEPITAPAVTETAPSNTAPIDNSVINANPSAAVLQPDGCKLSDSNAAPAMVAIRPEHFQMGSPDSEPGRYDNEGPQHQVTIPRPFALSRCEISVGQFKQFIDETGYQTTAETDGKGCYVWKADNDRSDWEQQADRNWKNPGFAQTEQHPVVCVSWQDAQRYVQWLSQRSGALYRLPTEAEWEYAAMAGMQAARYFGDASQCEYANGLGQEAKSIAAKDWVLADCSDNYVYTAPVGSFKPNPFGLYDMLGNVVEWTLDCWHDNYAGAPGDGSAWLEAESDKCDRRVLRGGSWNFDPQFLRSAFRLRYLSDAALIFAGFRVARAL